MFTPMNIKTKKIEKIMLFLGTIILFSILYRYIIQYSDLTIIFLTGFPYSGEKGLKIDEKLIFGFLVALNIFIRQRPIKAILITVSLIFLAFLCSVILTYLVDFNQLFEYIVYNEILAISLIYLGLCYFVRKFQNNQ